MIIISHRGNLNGPTKEENNPNYLLEALQNNFYAEADIWLLKGKLYLGHDEPKYPIKEHFLLHNQLIFHCKEPMILEYFNKNTKGLHYFWHEHDCYTLTSKNIIWAYPGNVIDNCITVLPETIGLPHLNDLSNCYGICTDHPIKYRELYGN